MEIKEELDNVLFSNYLPYAKTTIISRALCAIDGFKPVQRRILYTMHGLGLLSGNRVKSQKVNGATMTIHPNGDSSIYESLVLMSKGYNAFNVPYIDSKGSFGAKYSRDLKYSAPRYTEVKLAPICKELFDGIKENAVDLVDNFDSTEKEPTLLPVKFPTVLVNTSAGVAVGTSSNIPSFSLTNVCKATQGLVSGKIKKVADLAPVLGVPEFTTGGFVHADNKSLVKLCETGRGSFIISGKVEVYQNRIIITEIPYCTTAEDIMDAIEEAVKDKRLKGVREVLDEIGKDGMKLVVEIKAGYNSREVLAELCRMTPLRTSISFRTRVIINDRCRELGLYELLLEWIDFREKSIQRKYQFRLDKNMKTEHVLSAWEKVVDDIQGLANGVVGKSEAEAKAWLMNRYGLDDEQAEYILDFKVRFLTSDNADKKLKELEKLRNEISDIKSVVDNQAKRYKIIYDDQEEIINKYGTENKTTQAAELKEEDLKKPEVKISDEEVVVVLTKNGFMRRLTLNREIYGTFVSKDGDPEVRRWYINNNKHILVFDRFGTVHKILVDTIDTSTKAQMTDSITKLAGLEKMEDIIYVDSCGDYTGYFNLIYLKGDGIRVNYDKAYGKRSQYKGLYKEVPPHQYLITKEDQFFAVTNKRKATYVDIRMLGQLLKSNRIAFKVARMPAMEYINRVIPYSEVPYAETINLEKYSKDYTVSIGHDVLWIDEDVIKEGEQARKELMDEFEAAQAEANASSEELESEETLSGEEYDEDTEEDSEYDLEAAAREISRMIEEERR